jgi:PAS domain S-box-containing protein
LMQRRQLDLPFIIVSGHIDEDTAVASMKAGAHDYVMKDRLTRLAPAIERELKEAEMRRARWQEEAFRRTIEQSIPSGLAAVDAEGKLTYVNAAFCEMVGLSESELRGVKAPHPFWPASEAENIRAALSQALAGEAPHEGFELRFKHSSGKLFDVLLLIQPLKDAQGKVLGWLGSVTDITQRRQAERRLHVQYTIARALSKAPNLRSAAAEILGAIGEGAGWTVGTLWRVRPEADELECIGTWREPDAKAEAFEAACRAQSQGRDMGISGRVLTSGKPLWVQDVMKLKQFPRAAAAAAADLHGACCFPIRLGQETLGTIEFFSHEIREPDETLLQWMGAIGNQIGQFMERQLAQEALRRAHDELELRVQQRTADLVAANQKLEAAILERKRLEHELLEITEKERRRIGLDLHDDLGQKLTGITLMLKGLTLGLKKRNVPEALESGKIEVVLQQTVEHASNLARDLALADLPQADLPSALAGLAENVKRLFEISCHFKVEGAIPPLDKNAIMQFYKITQEAVTNSVKHGKAKQVNIHLVMEPEQLVLTIRNNGLPFPSMIDKHKGMGLRIMNYRANTIGASLEVKPGRPHGTVVTCWLPVKPQPAKKKESKARST